MQAPPLPSKKSGGFLRRFSIGGAGSKNSSFSTSAQSPTTPDTNAAQGPASEDLFGANSNTFDSRKMLDNIMRSSFSDRDDQSEVSSISATQKKDSSFRKIFRRKSKKKIVATFSIAEEFTRLRDNWSSQCASLGHNLSNSVLAELNKRIGSATSAVDKKTKLNLTKCDLNDTQLASLVRELAVRPVLSKLELDNNHITSQGAECLRKLMVAQLELGEMMDPSLRVNAVFLAEVSLQKSKLAISLDIIEEINSISVPLAQLNACNAIANAYSEKGAPMVLDSKLLSEIWLEVTGKSLDKRTLQGFQKAASTSLSSGGEEVVWSYAEAEVLLLEGLRKLNLLPNLTPRQDELVTARRKSFQSLLDPSLPNMHSTDSRHISDEDQDITPPTHNRSSWQQSQSQSSAHYYSYGGDTQSQSRRGYDNDGIAGTSQEQYDNNINDEVDDDPSQLPVSITNDDSPRHPSSEMLSPNVRTLEHSNIPTPLSTSPLPAASSPNPALPTDQQASTKSSSSSPSSPDAPTPSSLSQLFPSTYAPIEENRKTVVGVKEIGEQSDNGKDTRDENNLHSDRHAWNADKKIPSPIIVTSPTGKSAPSTGRGDPPKGWTPTSPAVSDCYPDEENEYDEKNENGESGDVKVGKEASALDLEESPHSSTDSSPRGTSILSLRSGFDVSQHNNNNFSREDKSQNSAKSPLSPLPQSKLKETPDLQEKHSPVKSNQDSPHYRSQDPFQSSPGKLFSSEHNIPRQQSRNAACSPVRTQTSFSSPSPRSERAGIHQQQHQEILQPEQNMEMEIEVEVAVDGARTPSESDNESLDTKSPANQANMDVIENFSAQKLPDCGDDSALILTSVLSPSSAASDPMSDCTKPDKALELSMIPHPPSESNDLICLPGDGKFAIDLSDEDLEVSTFHAHKSKSGAHGPPSRGSTTTAVGPASKPNKIPSSPSNCVQQSSHHLKVASVNVPSKATGKIMNSDVSMEPLNNSSSVGVNDNQQQHSVQYNARIPPVVAISKNSHPSEAAVTAHIATPVCTASVGGGAENINVNVNTAEGAEAALSAPPAVVDNRVFALHGIRRKRFSASDISLLRALPQLLHATELASGEKLTIGKESPASTTTSTTFISQTVGPEYFKLSSEMASSIEISNRLESGATHPNGIKIADLAGCIVQYLPELRLNIRFPALLELNLSNCSLSGRLPAGALPRSLLRLDLSRNDLIDFSGVMTCPNIQELNLSHNAIETVHAIPLTLIRLNIACNLIWNKVCLRIIALSPELQSVCLDGNPVTVLVPGWAAVLRSMSPKLHSLDGRRIEPTWKDLYHDVCMPAQMNRNSPFKSFTSGGTQIQQKVTLTAQEQRLRDEERARQREGQHPAILQRQRDDYINQVVMPSIRIPEKVVLESSVRLSAPKYTTDKPVQKKKKAAGVNPPTSFGTSKRDLLDSFVIRNAAENSTSKTSSSSDSARKSASKMNESRSTHAKWSKSTAVQAIDAWTEKVAECLENSAILINHVDQDVAQQSRPVTQEDVQAFQRSLLNINITDCDPLPFPVKLGLDTLHADARLVSTITLLHEKLKNYAAVLYRLERALVLCAGASKSFGVSFRIIMNSETGLLINDVPKIEALPAQSVVSRARERIMGSSMIDSFDSHRVDTYAQSYPEMSFNTDAEADAAADSRPYPISSLSHISTARTSSIVNASPTKPTMETIETRTVDEHTTAHALSSTSAPAVARTSVSFQSNRVPHTLPAITQWKAESSERISQCSKLLKSITDRFSRTDKQNDVTGKQDLAEFLKELQSHIQRLELSQYDVLPATIEAMCASQPDMRDALAALRSFKGLFAQVENMLYLCNKGGIEFKPALQVLMNSNVGRAVKNALLGAKSLTILTPRLSSPAGKRSPQKFFPSELSATSGLEESKSAVCSQSDEVEVVQDIPQTAAAPTTAAAAAALPVLEDKDRALEVQEASGSDPSNSSMLNESVDQLEFAVVVDPNIRNVETVKAWLDRCECVLGRAAISMSSAIDLAHSSQVLTAKTLTSMREDHSTVGIASCEPPPKAVNIALQALGRDHPLYSVAWETRMKLDAFDDIFSQVENALGMCLEYQQDFQYAFDLLMRTDAGIKANGYMHGIYSYSSIYD